MFGYSGRAPFGTLLFLLCAAPATAQMGGMMHDVGAMTGPMGIPMNRMGSGTSWIPDAVPMPSHGVMAGSWDLMLHGAASLQYEAQEGPRGDSQVGSVNWAMFMAGHELAGGRLQLRSMLSLDAATVTEKG